MFMADIVCFHILVHYLFQFYVVWILRLINFTIELTDYMMLLYLQVTRSYTQHALRPVIDSKINPIRHFIKIPFNNKGMDLIDLPSVFRDKSVQSSIPNYFKNFEVPIICYKYLLGALYLISIKFLILKSKLVTLTPETARTLNMFIRLRVMLLRAI